MAKSGTETTSAGIRLCDFLSTRRHAILQEWEQRIRGHPVAASLSRPALRDHIPQILERLSHIVRGVHTGATETLGGHSDDHALHRLDEGYDLHTAVQELAALRDTILALWEREVGPAVPLNEVRRLDQALDALITTTADRFVQARERTLQALERVSAVAMGWEDLEALLPRLLSVVAETVEAVDTALLLLRDSDDVLHLRAALGLGEGADRGFSVRVGEGFEGLVASRREPLLMRDASQDSRVRLPVLRERGIHALYGVPLLHEGAVIGVALMGSRTAYDFSASDQQLFRSMARRATSLIVKARLLAQLRLGDARLQAIVDHAPAAIYVKDLAGRYTLVNRPMERIFRRPRDQLLGRDDRELLPPDEAAAVQGNDARVLAGHGPLAADEVVLQEDGPHTYLSVKFALPDAEGRPAAVCGISSDITERRRVLAALRASEERFRLLVEGVEDYALLMLDPAGHVASWNTGAERILGWRAEEVLGQSLSRFHTPEDVRAGVPDRGLRVAAAKGRYEEEALRVRRDGTRFWAHVVLTALPGESGRPRGFAEVMHDISARKEAQQAQALLVEAGTLLSQSLDVPTTLGSLAELAVTHLADLCVVDLLGEDGQLQRLEARARNPALAARAPRLLAFPPRLGSSSPAARAMEEGRPVVAADLTPAWLDALAHTPEHRALLEELAPRSAALVPLIVRGRTLGLVQLASVEPGWMARPGVLAAAEGVADRAAIAIENAFLYRKAQEAVRMREDVVAIVSHDLRNPLNAISMASLSLLRRGALDERQEKGLHRIHAAADRAHRMIRDLLDFTQARVGGGLPIHPRPVDLRVLARQVVEEVRLAHPDRNIELDVQELHDEGHGLWDEDRLAQALTNLVGNALQHGTGDSLVRVSVRGESGGLSLSVHNEGRPIPDDLLPTLFEPYRRGREASMGRGSIGLGLYITWQIVQGHGGRIDVRSREGEGTTFTMWLPRFSSEVSPSPVEGLA